MIEFVTLFLGLTIGIHPVEIAVGPEVAHVEVLLDSKSIGVMEGEPWRMICDFGPRLLPHKLEVVGRNREGTETGRAEQWINLPRQRAEAKLSLEYDAASRPHSARLIWEAVDSANPREVRVLLDGEPLAVENLDRIPLPSVNIEATHVLTAELDFEEGISATADVAFGGSFGDVVATDITSVVLRTEHSHQPEISDLEGRLLRRGTALRVVAVEKPAIEIIFVHEQSASLAGALQRLVTMGGAQRVPHYKMLPKVVSRGSRVRSVSTTAERLPEVNGPYELMPVSANLARRDGPSLFRLLTSSKLAGRESLARQRIADAVAVGGLVASAGNRRRAVILLSSGDSEDVSRLRPRLVRDYLGSIQVPLFIWQFQPPGEDGAPPPHRWPGTTEIKGWGDFAEAYRALSHLLESQIVVWVDGLHLQREITLSDEQDGLSLVGESSSELSESETTANSAKATRLERRHHGERPAADGGRPIALIDIDRLDSARQGLGEHLRTLQMGPVTLITDHEAPRLWKSLERLIRQLPELFSRRYGLSSDLESGVSVILYSDREDYLAFETASGLLSDELSGHAGPGLVALYAGDRSRRQIEATFTHELVHQLVLNVLGPNLPPWLGEGLAESMTFATSDSSGDLTFRKLAPGRPAGGGRLQVTGPFTVLPDLRDAIRKGELPTLRELSRLSREEFTRGEQGPSMYALSAFWVHYLSTAKDGVDERFRAYLADIAAGYPSGTGDPVGALVDDSSLLENRFRSWLLDLAAKLDSA